MIVGKLAVLSDDISDEFMLYYADIYDFTQENYIKKSYFNGKNIENKGFDTIIRIPEISTEISPVLSIIPLQLLSYYISKEKGLDVDKPRNLAKSVTVE